MATDLSHESPGRQDNRVDSKVVRQVISWDGIGQNGLRTRPATSDGSQTSQPGRKLRQHREQKLFSQVILPGMTCRNAATADSYFGIIVTDRPKKT